MKIEIDTDVDNVIIVNKKTELQFFISELLIYLSQIIMFFWVAFLVSNSLNDEKKLAEYINSIINEDSQSEIGYIFLATIITLGILTFFTKITSSSKWLEDLSNEVLHSFSRTIYFFGSSVTGSIIAVSIFTKINNTTESLNPEVWLILSLVFGLGSFLYGFILSYALNRDKNIITNKIKALTSRPT